MSTLTPTGQPDLFTRSVRSRIETGSAGETGRRFTNVLAAALITLCAALGVLTILAILAAIVVRGGPALNLDFFTQRPLPYGEVGGGVAPAIVGTLQMLLVAGVIGIPVGMATAIYLSEYSESGNPLAERLAGAIRFVVDLIAGLPSIVVGVFVWALLVRRGIGQYNGFAGSVALAVIMLPIIIRTVEEVLRLVPDTLREASLALGVPRWRTIMRVVLPTARAGLLTGILLSVARAGGETAPLLLTALGNQFFSLSFRQPMAALPVQIYNYAVAPYEDWHTKAWGSALVLILVIGVLNLLTRALTHRLR